MESYTGDRRGASSEQLQGAKRRGDLPQHIHPQAGKYASYWIE